MATFGSELLLAGSLPLPALAPPGVLAVCIKTQSSTQHLWYNDPFQDNTRGDFLQYVKFSATKIDAGSLNGSVPFSGEAAING